MNGDGLIVAGLISLVALFAVFFSTPGLFARFAEGLFGLVFSHRDIMKGGQLYLRRYFITPRAWLGYDEARNRSRWPRLLGWVPRKYRKIFLHHILLSDDRTPHDHPWDFTTRILAGEYVEWIGSSRLSFRRGTRGSVFRNRAEHVHTLEIVRPVWSLVFAGESRRVWGFWEEWTVAYRDGSQKTHRWKDWRSYLGCAVEFTEPEDQIDPTRFARAASADVAFFLGDVTRGNLRQPTAYWRDPRIKAADAEDSMQRVQRLWHESTINANDWRTPIAIESDCCPARCGGYCAIPIAVDDVPTRKMSATRYHFRDDGPSGEDAPKGKE